MKQYCVCGCSALHSVHRRGSLGTTKTRRASQRDLRNALTHRRWKPPAMRVGLCAGRAQAVYEAHRSQTHLPTRSAQKLGRVPLRSCAVLQPRFRSHTRWRFSGAHTRGLGQRCGANHAASPHHGQEHDEELVLPLARRSRTGWRFSAERTSGLGSRLCVGVAAALAVRPARGSSARQQQTRLSAPPGEMWPIGAVSDRRVGLQPPCGTPNHCSRSPNPPQPGTRRP